MKLIYYNHMKLCFASTIKSYQWDPRAKASFLFSSRIILLLLNVILILKRHRDLPALFWTNKRDLLIKLEITFCRRMKSEKAEMLLNNFRAEEICSKRLSAFCDNKNYKFSCKRIKSVKIGCKMCKNRHFVPFLLTSHTRCDGNKREKYYSNFFSAHKFNQKWLFNRL